VSGELERRYRRLLLAYPAAYRAERGDEIVDTYLELAAPAQRWPGLADAADLVRGGLRQHVRAAGGSGLLPALPIAATMALGLNAAMAVFWFAAVESTRVDFHSSDSIPPPSGYGFGPFASIGIVIWGAWALAALAALIGLARPLVTLALAATVLVTPVSTAFGLVRPPLMVLLPVAALGVVALAVPRRARFGPAVAAAACVGYTWPVMFLKSYSPADYRPAVGMLPLAALLLAAVVLIAAITLTVMRDRRAWWPALILLGPLLSLLVNELALHVTGEHNSPYASMPALLTTTAATAGCTALVTMAVLRVRRRRRAPAL
jgi:hypothetical protein